MAVITPNTDLYLLKVPLEINDINQLDFVSATAQFNYFNSLPKIVVEDYTYQRKDNTIRFGANFDEIISYNYVMYRNTEYNDKWFYAFITNMEYVNDNMTMITIKTDVWQTWQFDLTYKRAFVEREHVNDDTPGNNTVPEGLDLGEYEIVDLRNIPLWETTTPSTDWLVCFCVTGFPSSASDLTADGHLADDDGSIGGVFSSLDFFAVNTFTAAKAIIDAYNEDTNITADAIKNIYMIPSCCAKPISQSQSKIKGHYLRPLYNFFTSDVYKLQQPQVLAENYVPTNKKLLSYPFSYFYVTNKVGEDVVYHYEDFPFENIAGNNFRTISYQKSIVPSTSLSAKLYFNKYKSYSESSDYGTKMYNYGINYAKAPVCAWTTDYYTNWLTQNGVNVGLNIASSVAGIALAPVTGGLSLAGAVGSAFNIMNTLAEVHKASTVPDQAHGDINTGDFIYGFTRNSISLYEMSIRPEIARIIDGFFSQFGYKVNRVKIPNITGRRNWNYVKTIDCYIEADIPQEDLAEIKGMFDRGITIWHHANTFADYSQNNDII